MGKWLLILSLFIYGYSRAEIVGTKQVHCVSVEQAAQELQKYGEEPQFILSNDLTNGQSSLMFTRNKNTGTWTILEIIDNLACVVGFGKQPNL